MIKIHASADNQWYFTVCAANHKVLLTSETYKNKQNLMKGIAALQKVDVKKVKG
jgi:uncharacterized protein YegP (UPF0339 family)